MGCAGVGSERNNDENINQPGTICLHAFSDLSHISPAMFVYLLKECYMCGTLKATMKFRILRQHVFQALHNSPQPGPACFVIQCLYILPLLEPLYTEGFSHLLISSLHRLQTVDMVQIHTSDAKCLAARLFLDILSCSVIHEERILLKLLEVFNIELRDIGKAIYDSDMDDVYLGMVKSKIGKYIDDFVDSQSYITATTLMKHFSISPSCQSGQSFLEKLIHENQFRAAENWATLMGKQMICVLAQKYVDMKMLKQAYDIIKRHNLKQEFPDACHLYKQSSLKKLAEKGCWDVAEIRAKNDQQLLEYLVSIMQIASEKRVFIFDLIKLYEDEREGLDECFKSIFHSPKILKLGYNLQCDLHQLSHSYGDLECFRYYEMLLDIQKLFKEHRGGLSGLAKTILGAGLNKTRRNSNWEQRPLSQNQIEYAALDAAVLIHIFRHVHSQPHSADVEDKRSKSDWKSHIVSHLGNMRGCQSFAGNENDVKVNMKN